jgi:hypothetical protein
MVSCDLFSDIDEAFFNCKEKWKLFLKRKIELIQLKNEKNDVEDEIEIQRRFLKISKKKIPPEGITVNFQLCTTSVQSALAL